MVTSSIAVVISGLIKTAEGDLTKFKAAAAATPQQKKHFELLTGHLTNGLQAASEDDDAAWPAWLRGLQPTFTALAVELDAVLATGTGCCRYAGGGFSTTPETCQNIPNSTFTPGPGPCP